MENNWHQFTVPHRQYSSIGHFVRVYATQSMCRMCPCYICPKRKRIFRWTILADLPPSGGHPLSAEDPAQTCGMIHRLSAVEACLHSNSGAAPDEKRWIIWITQTIRKNPLETYIEMRIIRCNTIPCQEFRRFCSMTKCSLLQLKCFTLTRWQRWLKLLLAPCQKLNWPPWYFIRDATMWRWDDATVRRCRTIARKWNPCNTDSIV